MSDQVKAVLIILGVALAGVLLVITAKKLAKWVRKVKRRKGGVYIVRTRRHRGWRREIGYVGGTVSYHFRRLDHLGQGRNGHEAKPWSDLDPKWSYPLGTWPWWLCWWWIIGPAETLVIWATCPRYNIAKQPPWNWRKVPKTVAKLQRMHRDDAKIQGGTLRWMIR